jgi:hypothetical protein
VAARFTREITSLDHATMNKTLEVALWLVTLRIFVLLSFTIGWTARYGFDSRLRQADLCGFAMAAGTCSSERKRKIQDAETRNYASSMYAWSVGFGIMLRRGGLFIRWAIATIGSKLFSPKTANPKFTTSAPYLCKYVNKRR